MRLPPSTLLILLFLLACPAAAGIADPADVAAFFDGAVPAGMAEYNIPGASLVVVDDGEIVHARGYGYADITSKTLVDPEETLVHVGSITKLFTWTAVMQQVEAGAIDLDEDVNTYLKDFSIPETYPGHPVTMRHLMTHSAGFEEEEVHFAVGDAADLYPFRTYCRENIPALVYPPGTVTSYSNYGTTLAAVVLEDVTGIPYEQYVEERILAPLGMTDTILSYPRSPESENATASGYHYLGGKNIAVPDTLFVIGPAGTIASTATDMAAFLSAHMENGSAVLGADTARLMHAAAFSNDPRVSAMCLGFYENHINGERIIVHGGDTDTFHSLLAIIPERKAGFFVSYNSAGGNNARNDLLMAFVDRFWPDDGVEEEKSTVTTPVRHYAGTYQSTRHNYRSFEFYLSPPEQMAVVAGDEGTVLMERGGAAPVVYVQVEPGVFRRADGTETYAGDLVFREGESGDVEFLCLENVPIMAFEQVPPYATYPFTDGVKYAATALLLTALLWPLAAVVRRFRGDGGEGETPLPSCARAVAGSAAILFLLFTYLLLPAAAGDPALVQAYMWERTTPVALAAALAVPVVAVLLSAAAALFLVPAWKNGWWTLRQRAHYTLVVIGLLMMAWWANFWNLFLFRV
ncbi:serine hydrolase domain-containing protein [Methanofollis fontis]|uniref:Beta-lactamase-related domain-containing protein n=1 Tax=Methanofollis fontis TaxID=2052832 RepID=A0A483CT77_9EURY|nr:serine hydrolase domain-containing protein [Methanofollis fontis]TAJ45554.1 hypothetical protein CUJ86_02175 [Methanofollis fontis]